MRLQSIFSLIFIALISLSCGSKKGDEKDNIDNTQLTYEASDLWIHQEPEKPMVVDQYILPGVRTTGSADMIITKIPSGETEKSTFERWYSEFVPPKGKYIEDVLQEEKISVDDASVKISYLHGTYKNVDVPAVMGVEVKGKENYALMAAFVESPKGKWSIKTVGPKNTIDYWRGNIKEFLKSLKIK